MNNNEVINGIAAILSASHAYQSLNKDILDPIDFEQAACTFIESLCTENPTLSSATSINNGSNSSGITFGMVSSVLELPDSMWTILKKRLPKLVHNHLLEVDVKIDFENNFSLVINDNKSTDVTASIVQQILIFMLKQNINLNFRCADFAAGGNIFMPFHKLVSLFPTKTGGKVYTKVREFSDLIKELESVATMAMEKLGSTYSTVKEFNKENSIKITEYLVILYLNGSLYNNEDFNRIRTLVENNKRNGISFIIIGTQDVTETFVEYVDFSLTCSGSSLFIGNIAKLPFYPRKISELYEIENIISLFQTSEIIDTHYENCIDFHTEYFTMDSSSALRIPFAIDKNNVPLYFEIGGNAPNHALIAGTTGSGKTVVLHTLIMQIIHNYHPDDVEIWAIDYKAVEFDQYIDHHSPHFKLIAHDTSEEFSLSLIDLLYKEYEKRQKEFLRVKVKNINEYRNICGKHSMPRIIVIIDEFQLMTQAVQEYTGNVDYRIRLENLLRLTRAMGISFILCSQTIASGLSGLSDASRDQIGCRICLKHDDDNEIRETLMLSGVNNPDIIAEAKELRCGQGIYKRARWANEHAFDGKAYEYLKIYILYFNDNIKIDMINTANALLKNDYTPKEEILVCGNNRVQISDKRRHPLMRFIDGKYVPDCKCIEWYPAAPTTLDDFFCIKVENTVSKNIMIIGEEKELRESIVIHSVCGFLMNPNNRIVVSIIDENHPERVRMINYLKKIQAKQLSLNIGIHSCLNLIAELRKIRPTHGKNTIYIWYGLDKFKNELFLMNQDDEDKIHEVPVSSISHEEMIADLMEYLSDISNNNASEGTFCSGELKFEDYKNILRQAFEVGPENNMLHMVIFNNRKVMKKSGFIEIENFENRIGMRMSTDDAYELFGSSFANTKTDKNTVIYYDGSGSIVPLRPYLMPSEKWFQLFNQTIKE